MSPHVQAVRSWCGTVTKIAFLLSPHALRLNVAFWDHNSAHRVKWGWTLLAVCAGIYGLHFLQLRIFTPGLEEGSEEQRKARALFAAAAGFFLMLLYGLVSNLVWK